LERARAYVDAFIAQTGWTPRQVFHVAGARLYTRQNRIGRWILGMVDRHRFDTRRDHVWTDWIALEQFAASFSAGLGPGAGSQMREAGPAFDAATPR
jgi:menaquinone-dependent protoporphyrinogen IX oxidase